jgi:hypothetical protein
MPTLTQKPTITRTLPKTGTHIARVIGLIYMGTITETYEGQEQTNQKIRLTWELPEELHSFKEGEDAKPLVHSEEYNLVMGKKSKLRPVIEGIIGVPLMDEEAYSFDVETLLDKPCLLSLKPNKKGTYMQVASVIPLMKGQVCKAAYNPIKKLTYEAWNQEMFDVLPQFIKDKMITSKEYRVLKGLVDEDNGVSTDSSIPF